MSEVFSILLHNRQRYEQGKEGLWFSLPTTTEKLQEALREIGISADNPQDFFLYDYQSPQERSIKLPRDLVLSADVDELNFLAARLEKLDAAELAELNAALTSPQSDFHSIGQIIDYPDNVDYYVHLPDVTGTGQLGDYYLNRSGMVDMPEEWKAGIFLPRFGLHIANTEHGVFTDYGYLVKSGDEWQRVHEGQPVPEKYRVMAFPAPEILRDEAPARTVQPEVAPTTEAAAPPPVVPIILNSQNSADRMKEITDRLETGIQELFESERYTAYLTSMAKFHSYSFNNTLLIAMQGGQLVAGYNKWRDDFHRNVKRGEKGIKILAPAPYKVKKEMPKLDEQGQPVMDKDGKPLTEVQETQVPAFKIVSVFDVSQTEGEPLPSIGVDELAGNVEQYEDFFKALEQTSPVPMAFEDIPGGSHGYYHLTEKRIAIQENMSELQTLKTAIHEIAHAKLHAIDPDAPVTKQADRPDSRTREVQAESVAYAVCQHYGLDTSDYSFGYVAGWSSGKDLKELRASLETIRATAHELITTIDGHLAELQQQRQAQQAVEQTVEQAAEQPAPDSVFSKLPPEQQQEMTDSVKAMLQTLIDADVKSTGEVTQGTLDAIQTQGFVLSGDGTLQRAEAQPEPQPWNGIDGLLNNKPIMPEATPTERANALIDWAERNGQRMGNEERRLIVEYAEAVGNTDKVIELINRLCEHGYEMQHGHVDELVKSRIDREIAEAKAAQQPTLDPTAEPVVTILFTESPNLEMGQQMPLHEADALFARLDAEHRGGGYYDKTDFRIDFTFQGEPHSYSGRQDFGDRDGSLIEHIREYQTFYLNDEKWKDHLTRQGGPEAWAEDHASREAFLTEIIPYMELHCNLSRLEQEAQTRLASSDTLTPEETAYYGALVDYDYHPEDKSISVNEEEAEIVRYIFRRYIEGAGGSVIAKELENLGYKTKRGSTRWAETTVIGIIKNEKYKGDILMGKTFTLDPISKRRLDNFGEEDQFYIREHHEAIISDEMFEKAQEILKRRAKPRRLGTDGKREKFSRKYAFSCMLECGFCGGTLTRRSWHSGSQYNKVIWQCVTATKKGKKFCPDSKGIAEETIEQAFIESYRLLCQNNKDVLDEFIARTEETLSDSNASKQLAKVEKDIAALDAKRAKLVDMRLEEIIDKDTYEQKYFDLSSQIEQLQKQRESLQESAETDSTMKKRIAEFRRTLEENEVLDTFDRYVFESIVEKVIVGGYDEDGNKDPSMLTFIYKTGFKSSLDGTNFKPPRKNSKAAKQSAGLCSHTTDEAKSMCSYHSDDTCRIRVSAD